MRPRTTSSALASVVCGAFIVCGALVLAGCGSDGTTAEAPPSTAPALTTTSTASAAGLATLLDDVAPEVADAHADEGSTTTTATVPDGGRGQGYVHSAGALAVLGDDPGLDAKALECFHADLSACDDLYVGSPDGSLYEAYGATCGARLDAPTNRLCVDVLVPAADDPTGLGDDEFLDALAEQCFAGDLLDCDLLYAESDTGSQYEAYGGSCGRRTELTEEGCAEVLLGERSR